MATIAVIGGTGYAGGHIAAEAAARGHDVTAIGRHAPAQPIPGVGFESGSIFDLETVRSAAARPVVVVALPAYRADGPPLVEALPRLADAVMATAGRLGPGR